MRTHEFIIEKEGGAALVRSRIRKFVEFFIALVLIVNGALLLLNHSYFLSSVAHSELLNRVAEIHFLNIAFADLITLLRYLKKLFVSPIAGASMLYVGYVILKQINHKDS